MLETPETRWRLRPWVAAVTAALVSLWALPAIGQQQLEPGETRVQTGDSDDSDDGGAEGNGDSTDGDEAAASGASGVEQLDVAKNRVRPDELPPPSASKTDVPDVLRNAEGNLPEPPSADELSRTDRHVRDRVFEVVAVEEVDAPGDASSVVHRGHAVLVGGRGDGPPVLISTYFWLDAAEKLYVVPSGLSSGGDGERNSTPEAERRSVDDVTANGTSNNWIASHEDQLARARLFKPDRHRNLVTIVPDQPDKLNLPDKGLELFDLTRKSPMRLYGYTPQNSKSLQKTRLLESHPDEESLVYYLQTPYSPVFGAPIVGSDGSLLVLTAFQHPNQSGIVLAIPPKPIAAYVDDVFATLD